VPDAPDPRTYFAAERTLLAWMRTGVAIIGLGFLVARFGLFLRLIRQPAGEARVPLASSVIGVALVILGASVSAAAACRHVRFYRRLPDDQRPPRSWLWFGITVAVVLAGLGGALAVYLVWSVRSG
jgi:putative membrane protein